MKNTSASDYIIEKMTALGFEIIKPDSTFYIFAEFNKDLQSRFAGTESFTQKEALLLSLVLLWALQEVIFAYLIQPAGHRKAVKRLEEYMK